MADGRHFESWEIAISQQWVDRSQLNLAWWRI